jgi:hypothetical protein
MAVAVAVDVVVVVVVERDVAMMMMMGGGVLVWSMRVVDGWIAVVVAVAVRRL